jgi:hypothetical protein
MEAALILKTGGKYELHFNWTSKLLPSPWGLDISVTAAIKEEGKSKVSWWWRRRGNTLSLFLSLSLSLSHSLTLSQSHTEVLLVTAESQT